MTDYSAPDEVESDIEREAKKRAKKRGWFVAKLMRCDVNSMPDCVFHRRGFTMYIEFKAPGKPADTQQLKRHREIRAHGIAVHVVDDLEHAYELLQ